MKGLTALLPHLITVALLWLAAVIIIHLIKRGAIKSIDKLQTDQEPKEKLDEKKKQVQKLASTVTIGATVIAAAVGILVVFFLYNPTERSYEEMENIKTADVDANFVEPSTQEIDALNVKSHDVIKSEQKEAEAQKDNIEAMQESIDLFRKIAEEAQKAKDANAAGADVNTQK